MRQGWSGFVTEASKPLAGDCPTTDPGDDHPQIRGDRLMQRQ